MAKDNKAKIYNVRDGEAPKLLQVTLTDPRTGKQFGNTMIATDKVFSTTSVGFYASDKAVNNLSGCKYQVSLTMTLVNSKEDPAKSDADNAKEQAEKLAATKLVQPDIKPEEQAS